MNSAADVLVIILSIFLAFFLLLGIVLTIYLIKLSRDIKRVTESASRTVTNLESALSSITKFTSPLFVAEFVSRYAKKIMKSKKGKKEDNNV